MGSSLDDLSGECGCRGGARNIKINASSSKNKCEEGGSWIYVCIYICVCTYMCVCICIYMFIYKCVNMSLFVYICIYVYAFIYTYVNVCFRLHT
jgi:hypothetical protein